MQNTSRPEPDSASPAVPPFRGRQNRATFIRLSVIATILLVLAMMGIICLRWAKVPEPTTAILVTGDSSLDGATILVQPVEGNEQASRPVKVVLDADNKYQTPIFRYPGRYHITATVPWLTEPIFDGTVELDRLHGAKLDLPTALTIVGDDSLSGAEVKLVSEENKKAVGTLDKANQFRLWIPTPPGNYALTIARDGQTLMEDILTIDPHTPKQVDLRKKS